MRSLPFVVLSLLMLSTAGCTAMDMVHIPEPLDGWESTLGQKYTAMTTGQVPPGGQKTVSSTTQHTASVTAEKLLAFRAAYDEAVSNNEPDKQRRARDQILAELMILAKTYHKRHDAAFFYGKGTFDIVLDAGQLAGSMYGTVAGSTAAKAIAAAITGGLKGFQQAIDTRLFHEQSIAAVQAKAREQRLEYEYMLRAGMTLPAIEYSLDAALVDWVDFLLAGSLHHAVQGLVASAARDESSTRNMMQDQLLQIRNLPTIQRERAVSGRSSSGGSSEISLDVAILPVIDGEAVRIVLTWDTPVPSNVSRVGYIRFDSAPTADPALSHADQFDNPLGASHFGSAHGSTPASFGEVIDGEDLNVDTLYYYYVLAFANDGAIVAKQLKLAATDRSRVALRRESNGLKATLDPEGPSDGVIVIRRAVGAPLVRPTQPVTVNEELTEGVIVVADIAPINAEAVHSIVGTTAENQTFQYDIVPYRKVLSRVVYGIMTTMDSPPAPTPEEVNTSETDTGSPENVEPGQP